MDVQAKDILSLLTIVILVEVSGLEKKVMDYATYKIAKSVFINGLTVFKEKFGPMMCVDVENV